MRAKTKFRKGLKVHGGIRAGGLSGNHTRGGLKVRLPIKAGGIGTGNHNRTGLRTGLKVRVPVRAGGIVGQNHNRTFAR